jgi:hypothetical protein
MNSAVGERNKFNDCSHLYFIIIWFLAYDDDEEEEEPIEDAEYMIDEQGNEYVVNRDDSKVCFDNYYLFMYHYLCSCWPTRVFYRVPVVACIRPSHAQFINAVCATRYSYHSKVCCAIDISVYNPSPIQAYNSTP